MASYDRRSRNQPREGLSSPGRWKGQPNKRRSMHLPTHLKQVVTAAGASIHPTCKTLEEVVLIRKCDTREPRRLPALELDFAENLNNHPHWQANTLKVLRGRRELPRSIPVFEQTESREELQACQEMVGHSIGKGLTMHPETQQDHHGSSILAHDFTMSQATASSRSGSLHSSALHDLRSQLHSVLTRLNHLEWKQMENARIVHMQRVEMQSNQTSECATTHDVTSIPAGTPKTLSTGFSLGAAGNNLNISEPGTEEKEEMIMVMDGIQDTIKRLERALSTTEQEAILRQEQIQAAATRLAAAARGHLQRQRFTKALQALRRWRKRNGSELVRDHVNTFMRRRRKILDQVQEIEVRRDEQTKEDVLRAWCSHVISTRGERARILREAEVLRHSLELDLLRTCMLVWHEISSGPRSRKAVENAYKQRYAKVVARIEAGGEDAIVKHKDVIRQMNEEASEYIINRRAFHMKRTCFNAWAQDFLFDLIQLKKRADRFFKLQRFPKFLQAWKDFVKIRQSEAKIAYTWDPSRFDQDHNSRVVKNFTRRLLLRKFTKAWHNLARQNCEVRDRQRAVLRKEVAAVFKAWHTRIRFQLQIKRICIEEWKELGYRRRQLPFRAWYIYTKKARKMREAQAVLLSAFQRRKRRLLEARFFRVWKHKAIYGKIGGLHTRADLFKALDTQKKMLLAMEVSSDQQKEAIAELEGALQAEKNRSETFQLQLADKKEETIQIKFAQQQLEEELVRLQALFDAMSLIHPGTAKRLLAMRADNDQAHHLQGEGVSTVARRAGEKTKMMSAGASPPSNEGGLLSNGSRPSGPCVKCGYDPSTMVAQPHSARARLESYAINRTLAGQINSDKDEEDGAEVTSAVTPAIDDNSTSVPHAAHDEDDEDEFPLPLPLPRPTLDASAVVWVTSQDASVINRTLWAQKKLKELATRKHMQQGQEDGSGASSAEMEVCNLQSILAFVLSGNLHDLELFEADSEALQEYEQKQAALALMNADTNSASEMLGNLRKARIHSLGNWNDFLQGLGKQFPLMHPANDNARLGVERRIVSSKEKAEKARLSLRPKGINMYSSTSRQDDSE